MINLSELLMIIIRKQFKKYLRNYMGLYKYKDQHNKYYQKKIFLHIFKEIVNSLCALKFSDFKYDSKFFAI